MYILLSPYTRACSSFQQLHCPVKINKIDYDCLCRRRCCATKKSSILTKKKFWIKYQREIFYSICISLPASSHTTTTNERMWYTLKTFFPSFWSQFTIKYVIHCSCSIVTLCVCRLFDKNSQFSVLFIIFCVCKFIAFFVH